MNCKYFHFFLSWSNKLQRYFFTLILCASRFAVIRAEITHLLSGRTGRLMRLTHGPNKNRASSPLRRQKLIGDVNGRVPGITFVKLFLDDRISDRESMRPKWFNRQPPSSAGFSNSTVATILNRSDIHRVSYRQKLSA